MPTFSATRAGYRNLWDKCQIRPERLVAAKSAAQKIIAHKAVYQDIEAATGVPWFFIGCTHLREGNLDFSTYLGNGQSLSHITTEVPKGRGPFSTFKAGAIDALHLQGYTKVKTWTIELVLYDEEALNGWGYVGHGENSPYLWAATNLQQRGKYTSDGRYDPTVMDTQLGVAAVLKAMAMLDADVAAFCKPGIIIAQPKEPTPVATPSLNIDFKTLETLVEQGLPFVAKLYPPLAAFEGPLTTLAKDLLNAVPGSNPHTVLSVFVQDGLPLIGTFFPPVAPFVPVISGLANMLLNAVPPTVAAPKAAGT